ncbi:hypothetical protein H310_15382 [Aphanomyces invadans]|uniref:Uncharacterized protein n=1 Tax=Aphanomyces invadans TaxID=157072 RepID=A0A024T7I2_9STRA|nr:hypothetical protein H310_15382 [Aphanomyces invadans]ETV89788.1 hypothetical protein H310_15382 [Aphanomyces invadans]|eukprot:XP_008881580.1 hypothetical protein H310_15382 [Aphanomyces invadans]
MWYGWLKRMRTQLKKCHRLQTLAEQSKLHHLRLRLTAAKRALQWHADHATAAAEVETAQLAFDSAKAEHRQFARDRQFDFHANSNERGTSHFFRRPLGTKVPINCVTVDGTTVYDEATVQATFTAHWRDIMVAPRDAHPPGTRCDVNEGKTRVNWRSLSINGYQDRSRFLLSYSKSQCQYSVPVTLCTLSMSFITFPQAETA